MKLKDIVSPFTVWKRAAEKPITIKDPIEDRPGADNYRGFHKNDIKKCIGCGTCESICQNNAIDLVPVDSAKTDMGDSGLRPRVDYGRCCWCALCVDVCPTSSLNMSNEYTWVTDDGDDFRYTPGVDKKDWDESEKGYKRSENFRLIDFERIDMQHLSVEERSDSFIEMMKGYSKEEALKEANRCLDCGICVAQCPAHMDIPAYIRAIRNNDMEEALKILYETNPFSSTCGRVCTHRCEEVCALSHQGEAIAIRWLKRYILDQISPEDMKKILDEQVIKANGKKVAIIGAGPGGLSAAYYLRLLGYELTVFEAKENAGGMLRYGIPEYRLPYDQLDKDINYIESIGVEIKTKTKVGKDITFEKLDKDFDAIYFSTGLEKASGIRCEGENLPGVILGINLLKDVTDGKRPDLGKKVMVIGGGNVAMDVARTSVRLGSDVTVLYRRRIEDMPADQEEIDEALEEKVTFNPQSLQTKIEKTKDNRLKIHWNNMKMVENPGGGRPKPVPIEGDFDSMTVDKVFAAIGQKANFSYIPEEYEKDLEFKWGKIVTKEFGKTSLPKIFAGGDAMNWTADAVSAIADGHLAAKGIDDFLKK